MYDNFSYAQEKFWVARLQHHFLRKICTRKHENGYMFGKHVPEYGNSLLFFGTEKSADLQRVGWWHGVALDGFHADVALSAYGERILRL